MNHYLENFVTDPGVLKLIVFSDNCAGQNKNINLMLLYLRLIHSKRLSGVHHYYLETGHSYLPCDRDFGVLEKHLRPHEVYSTEDYCSYMKTCRITDPATVIRLTADDFIDYDILQQLVSKAGQTRAGFKSAKRLIAADTYPQGIKVCAGYGEGIHEPREWKLQKGRSNTYDPDNFDL